MGGFSIKLSGFDEVIKKLDLQKFKDDVADELNTFGLGVQRDAKDLAPVDESDLYNSIYWKPTGSGNKIGVEVGCAVDYAAFLEFGTRKLAAAYVSSLPPDWQAFAAQYRGAGSGTFQEMVARITAWVKRKGFAAELTKSGNKSKSKSSEAAQDQAAYLIARSILINGIKPHPFLFPAVEMNRDLLLERLRNLINA